MNCRKVESVAWSSKEEWKLVYMWLYSSNKILQQKALSRISVWKERSGSISPGIDVTAILVRARMNEDRNNLNPSIICETDELSERALYSTAIMEFISYVSAHAILQFGKLKTNEAIEKMNVPQWLLGLRHQSAHGIRAPLPLFKRAAQFALEWIRKYYWEEKNQLMQDVYSQSIEKMKAGPDSNEQNLEDIIRTFKDFKKQRYQMLKSSKKDSLLSKKKQSETAVNAKISCDSSECARVLCSEECLFMDIKKLINLARQGGSNATADKLIVDFWSPVFVSFIQYHKTDCLLEHLIHQMKSSDNLRRTRAVIWIKLLMKNITDQAVESIEWRNILKSLLENPDKLILEILECILDRNPSTIEETVKEDILNITKLYMGMDIDEDASEVEKDENVIYTADDCRFPEVDIQRSSWCLATDIDWYNIPIGTVMINKKLVKSTDCEMSNLLNNSDIFAPNTEDSDD